MKYYIPIKFADFDNIIIKNGTPHCKKYGAMNKMNILEDKGGYWRTISAINNSGSTICRSGCCEKRCNIFKFLFIILFKKRIKY